MVVDSRAGAGGTIPTDLVAKYDFPLCPEFERPVKAVIDCLETRANIDCSAIGIRGASFGGYFAPGAAACEPRIKACVALSGAFQLAVQLGAY